MSTPTDISIAWRHFELYNPPVPHRLSHPIRARNARDRDFRFFLQAELSRRLKEDARYSLRSFAGFLNVDPSALAKLLKGDRPVGPRLIRRFGRTLGLAPDEIDEFIAEREHRSTRSRAAPSDYQQITIDTFRIISDWYHYAILELIRVDQFRPDPRWISTTLNIPLVEVNFAIERLIRTGLLEITPHGHWIERSEVSTNIAGPFTDAGKRKLQKQILEKAIHALEHVPLARRDQTSMTMAIDEDRIVEAKERITAFRRELAQFLSRGTRRNQVYHLSISLYPVSNVKSPIKEGENS